MVATSVCALRSTAATLSLPSSATNSALAGKIDRKMVDLPRHLAERDPGLNCERRRLLSRLQAKARHETEKRKKAESRHRYQLFLSATLSRAARMPFASLTTSSFASAGLTQFAVGGWGHPQSRRRPRPADGGRDLDGGGEAQ